MAASALIILYALDRDSVRFPAWVWWLIAADLILATARTAQIFIHSPGFLL